MYATSLNKINKASDAQFWSNFIPIITVVGLVIFIIIIFNIFRVISKNYISKNKDRILKTNSKFFAKFKKEAKLTAEGLDILKKLVSFYGLNRTIQCSSSVVLNASTNQVKYLMKYSNLSDDKEVLRHLEFMAVFIAEAAEFHADVEKARQLICDSLPRFYRCFAKKSSLPYVVCEIDDSLATIELPYLCFRYVSPAGRSMRSHTVTLDAGTIRELVSAISENIGKSGHKRAQRAAMTNDLREAIKKRDNYTCQKCGNSVYKEPNLLLEVDHIIPIAKGGKTEADNLQTLCWRCNRLKGTKRGRKHKK